MSIRSAIRTLAVLALVVAASAVDWSSAGSVRVVKRNDPSFDPYTRAPDATLQAWIRDHCWRMHVFSSYFDSRTAWYPNGWLYMDSYAIYNPSSLAVQHPEWILRDGAGRPLYIDWGWTGSSYPQYAADISNAGFRAWFIGEAKRMLPLGYRGLWIDDVNLDWRIAGGDGRPTLPIDRATGATMTIDAWRRYFAEFMEQLRRELPSTEILHNSIWYAGDAARDADPYIRRQWAAADWINLERGVNDPGLTGGMGSWSLEAVLAYIERLHAAGRAIVIDDFGETAGEREYAQAAYLLVSAGRDGLGVGSASPDTWWAGYQVELGAPLGARTAWNGLKRRDFSGGIALVNEPGAPTRTVTLPGAFLTVDGRSVTSVTLGAKSGAVLRAVSAPPPPPPVVRSPYGGAARAIPGTIEAEDFDNGGDGVAYHDLDPANNGGGYRAGGVDIRACIDAGGGWQVGWMGAGEWLEYSVTAAAGTYDIAARVASGSAGATVRVAIDGVDRTGPMVFAHTGGWDSWLTVTRAGASIAAGPHVVRLSVESGTLDLNWLRFTGAGGGIVPGGWYKLVAKHSGKCLDVANASTANGANVQQWSDNGSTAQQWRIDAVADGTWTLTARCSGEALDVAGGSLADGGDVLQWPLHGGPNQRWRIEPVGGGWYRVVSANSGKVLDVSGVSTADGADVAQWGDWGGDNQRWALVPVAPGALAADDGWVPDASRVALAMTTRRGVAARAAR